MMEEGCIINIADKNYIMLIGFESEEDAISGDWSKSTSSKETKTRYPERFKPIILLLEISDDEIELVPKQRMTISYYKNADGSYSCDFPELNLFCWGNTFEELIEYIKENIIVDWIELVECDESELTNFALHLRNKYLKYFRRKEDKI